MIEICTYKCLSGLLILLQGELKHAHAHESAQYHQAGWVLKYIESHISGVNLAPMHAPH